MKKKILLIRSAAIGDVFLASGAIPALKKVHPNCDIIFKTRYSSILNNIDGVNCITHDHHYDRDFEAVYNLDLCYELNPNLSILQSIASIINIHEDDIIPHIYLTAEEITAGRDILIRNGVSERNHILAMQSSSSFWVRNISDIVLNHIVAHLTMNHSFRVVHLGNKNDMSINGVIDLRGALSLRESIAVLSLCSAFVGIDSCFLHIAKSFQMPTLSFWGAVNPRLRVRPNSYDLEMTSDMQCAFCHHRQIPPAFITVCKKQNPIFILLDLLWQHGLRNKNLNMQMHSISARLLSSLLQFREKGNCIPVCMKKFENELLSDKIISWINSILHL